jgi:hypothetical protein
MSARDTVLVIGAGASYGARSNEPRPPLGAQLADYLLTWFDENAPNAVDREWSLRMGMPLDATAPSEDLFDGDPDVRPILLQAAELSKTSTTGFEAVMAELLRDGNRTVLNKLNEVICFALLGGKACHFSRQADLFDELFMRLEPRLRGIVTPNYDLLAEEAIERTGLSYRYRGVDNGGPTDAVVVIDKFHGSVNWLQPPGPAASASLEAAQRMAKPLKAVRQKNMLSFFNDHPVHASVGDRRANAFLGLKQTLHGSPVLVTYGPGKDAMFGRNCLDRIRAECAADLQASPPRRIIAVGISPPRGGGDDDAWEDLCKLFSSLDSAREYWSGNGDERTKMAAYRFDGRDGWFADLIAASSLA